MDSEPLSIRSMPARQRSSVVLPDPDGPSSTRNDPGSTDSETDFRAGTLEPGYVLVSEVMAIGEATDRSSDSGKAAGGPAARAGELSHGRSLRSGASRPGR